ncbi:unnamed protein product [Cyprideis torosa]|uniref:dihydropyrimidinase n=1 Tax=Cyprideis torosa TaxID=163714 RepID=A0A7R8WRF4_9CRUS|nr:unnamed protein product [Cyprideis torosa]CAG0903643.1 unnamed protein product [Cyprideis torosa]
MRDILIKNGLVVTAEETRRQDVLISKGVIAAIGEDLESGAAQVLDATGQYVLPGGVDVHTHLSLQVGGFRVSDGFYMGSVAAAFGGTTCVVEHPSFGPEGCSLLHQISVCRQEAESACVIDFSLHGVFQHCTPRILSEIPALLKAGVSSAKVYMTYAYRLEDRAILQILQEAKHSGLLVTFHAENHEGVTFCQDQLKQENRVAVKYYPRSRPACCEAEAIHRIACLAEVVGDVAVYIVHLSTASGLAVIEAAQKRGVPIYAEVCPQYLLLDDCSYAEPENRGLRYIMAPPLRTKADNTALWQGLARGSIATVATDHCSFTSAEKYRWGKDDFTKAPGGIPGVETRLPLLFSEGVLTERISLNRFVELTSTMPAKIMGLYPRKGNLAPGADGDIVLFDPCKEVTLSPGMLQQNADYTPFHGRMVRGWPSITIVRGKIVVEDGKLMAESGWGTFIHRRSAGGSFAL